MDWMRKPRANLVLRQLVGNEGPIGSLAVLSLAVMPTLVFVNQEPRPGCRLREDMGLLLDVTDPAARDWRVRGVGWRWADPVAALAILPVILWQGGRRWLKRVSLQTTRTDASG
jgi:hypothetical protein